MQYKLRTPVTREDLAPLRTGDTVLLSGAVYTARDAAHKRMMELLDTGGSLPFPVEADGQSTGVQACLMVPLRAVAEPLGFTVTWDDGGVLVDNGTLHTRVVIGQDRYTLTTSIDGLVDMSAPFSLGAPPYVANGVTYVPVALFDALLGDGAVTVTDSGTVSIQAPPPAALP